MDGLAAKGKIAGDAMATVAKVGLVAIGVAAGSAIKHSIEFQKQMTLLQTQAGASAQDMGELHDRVLELARVRPQGPNELAKGLYHFQSVFQNSKAAFDALSVASKGAAVGNADLEETSTALGSALRSTYRETIPTLGQMNGMMGQLNAIVGAGNMRMDELTLALGTGVVPAGITAGLTIKDIGGALAVLTDEGQRADNAATHLRMAFTLMGAQSKIAEKNLGKIGIKATELGTIMQSAPPGMKMVNALELVREKLAKKFPTFGPALAQVHDMHDAQMLANRFQTISKAFGGARSSATIMLLLNNLDLLKDKTKFIPDAEKSTSKLNHAFEVWGKTADAKVRVSLSDLQASLTEFGDAIRDHAVKWLVKFIHVGSELVKHMDTILPIFASYIAAWVALKLAIMAATGAEKGFIAIRFLQEIGLWIAEVHGLADAFALMGITLETIPAFWIITAIGLVIVALFLLWKHWKDIWGWIKEHWGAAAVILQIFMPFLVIPMLIAVHWNKLKGTFHSVLKFLGDHLGIVGETAKSIFGHIVGYMKAMVAGAIAVINVLIRAYNKLPGFMRPTGQVEPIGGWGMNEGPNKNIHMPSSYRPMALGGPGPVSTGFGPANSLGQIPGGAVRQPSLRKPRSHVPDPVSQLPTADDLILHNHVYLDGKEIFKNTSKHAANKKARK